jgi:hypothetical protein
MSMFVAVHGGPLWPHRSGSSGASMSPWLQITPAPWRKGSPDYEHFEYLISEADLNSIHLRRNAEISQPASEKCSRALLNPCGTNGQGFSVIASEAG